MGEEVWTRRAWRAKMGRQVVIWVGCVAGSIFAHCTLPNPFFPVPSTPAGRSPALGPPLSACASTLTPSWTSCCGRCTTFC